MKADKIKGKTVWRLKVKYPLICASCPSYNQEVNACRCGRSTVKAGNV